MRTEDLVADLASRAAPVRPLAGPGVRAVLWAGSAVVCAALGIVVFGARSDIADVIGQPGFIWTAVVAIATAALAVMGALVLAIPGAERSVSLRGGALAFAAMWVATLVTAIVQTGQGFAAISDWPICFIRVIAISLVPAFVLVAMIRRAAPLQLEWTGILAMAAAMAIGAAAIQFICPVVDPAHALLGHFGPVLVLGALGAVIAGRLFRVARLRT